MSAALSPTDPKVKIISRDIITGDEKGYSSVEKASRAADIAAAGLKRSFIDKPRQHHGLYWRTVGMPYWRPPSGFVFVPTSTVVTLTGYIRAVKESSDEFHIYESAAQAADILGLTPRTVRENIDKQYPYGGFIWFSVPENLSGLYSNQGDLPADYVGPIKVLPSTIKVDEPKPVTPVPATTAAIAPRTVGINKTKGSSKGYVISRDLVTGQETVYRSMEAVKNELDINAHTLANTLLDKPRQAFGRHWRTEHATRFWNPPAYFKYNPASYANKTSGYIMATDASGNKTIYEGVSEAVDLSDVSLSGVKSGLKTGTCRGLTWTRLTEDDVQFWSPCLQVD